MTQYLFKRNQDSCKKTLDLVRATQDLVKSVRIQSKGLGILIKRTQDTKAKTPVLGGVAEVLVSPSGPLRPPSLGHPLVGPGN